MKPREDAALAARLIVGAVLVYAGAAKSSAPSEEFANIIVAYNLIPPDMALPLAAFLPWIELAVGWALVLGLETTLASIASGTMFAAFLLALGHALASGITLPSCGCFGEAIHLTLAQGLAFDSTLLALSIFIGRSGSRRPSLDSWADRGA